MTALKFLEDAREKLVRSFRAHYEYCKNNEIDCGKGNGQSYDLRGSVLQQRIRSDSLKGFSDCKSGLKGYKATFGRSSECKENEFLKNTMYWHGGSEHRAITRMYNSVRYGGGRTDSLLYLSVFKTPGDYAKSVRFKFSIKEFCDLLGFRGTHLDPIPIGELQFMKKVNLAANPGPSFSAAGCTSKLDSYALSLDCATEYFERCSNNSSPTVDPLFAVAGRAKLLPREKMTTKLWESEPIGRSVWMADSHESWLCGIFTVRLLQYFKDTPSIVLLGFNKFTDDPQKLTLRMSKFDTYINLDISKLDSSVIHALSDYAFNVVRYLFGLDHKPKYNSLLKRIRKWFVKSRLVLPDGGIMEKSGGHASGSDFITVINTLSVACVVNEGMSAVYGGKVGESFDFGTYGDNVIIGFNTRGSSDAQRHERGQNVLERLSGYITEVFSMKVNPQESKVSTRWFVQYGAPLIPSTVRLADWSSDYLRDYYADLSARLQRPLRPEERVVKIGHEPDGGRAGNTHRWTYIFAQSPNFLSYYFHENGTMIRPTFEVIERLFHPERAPKTLEEYKNMLFCALVENYNNKHTRNRIMHYWYDARHMESLGLVQSHQLRGLNNIHRLNPPVPRDRIRLPFRVTKGERSWYRRQRDVVNLESELCMADFIEEWRAVCSSIQSIFTYHSSTWWSVRKAILSKGRESRGLSQYCLFQDGKGAVNLRKQINYNAMLYGSKHFVLASKSLALTLNPRKRKALAISIVTGEFVKRRKTSLAGEYVTQR